MDIELFSSYCNCVMGCIIGIIAFSFIMYMICYFFCKCCIDAYFMEDNK